MRVALVAFVLVVGCTALPGGDQHCGEVRSRITEEWFAPTVIASGMPPLYGALVESELQREWDATYEHSPCGLAIQQGVPYPWPGPVLRPNERDALDVVLFEHSATQNAIPREGPWTVAVAVEGAAVRVEPASWTGEVKGDVHAAFLVEGVEEGKAAVRVFVRSPYDEAGNLSRWIEYVVNSTAGAPHRVG